MEVNKLLIINASLFFLFLTSSSFASYSSYDTVSNLTHTCQIRPRIVCVDVEVVNKTCVDPKCLIFSGGNYSACSLSSCNLNITSKNSSNVTCENQSVNATTTTCNGTWLYPNNNSICINATSWNTSICEMNNITCKINSTQCSLNSVFYIGGFFNLLHKDGWGNLPAAEIAINEVNNNTTNLADITLSLTALQSTQGLLSHGTQLLYTYFHSGPPKLMLLLPKENDLAKTVAAYAGLKQWGALQFSYATWENSLATNKKLFPRFFRLNPLSISYNRLRATFVASYATWKDDVGLLFYANSYYEEVNNDLKQRLKAKGITVVANIGFRSSPEAALEILKAKNAHIILTSMPSKYARKIFCKATKLKMFGPHYVWIAYGQMPFKFWIPRPGENLGCSEYEMACTVENHFAFHGAGLVKKTVSLISNPNVTFSKTYNNLVEKKNRSSFAYYAYDAVWTITNILQRARQTVEGRGKVLNELSYGDVNETQLFQKLAQDTDFKGVTGRVRFFENGNRKYKMSVLQIRLSGYGHVVGNYDEDKDVYSPSGIKWQGGIPYQRTTESYKWRNIELVLFVFWCIFSVFGILYALCCLFVVIKYRLERSIKYSSPTINVFIILGCLLCFITVILYGVDYQIASESTVSALCKVRLWIFSLGFTLCIGGLWVKVWALYQILVDRRVYKKRIMEYWMFGIVVFLLIIDIIYLAIWTAKDALYRTIKTVLDQPEYQCFQTISGNPFLATIYSVEVCDCANLGLWLGIFLAYKAIFLLCGFYMSWKVRNVYTRKLPDAQFAAKLLLLAAPFYFLGLIFGLTLRLHPTPHYALLGILILIYIYIVLGFLYGHKLINILWHPNNKVRSQDASSRYKCKCCPPVFCSWLASICCCCIAMTQILCCKVLWSALFWGPRKNRSSFVKDAGDNTMDYQIGRMPGDRETQIIILQKELRQKEEELLKLRRYRTSTKAVKQTQTTDICNSNDGHDCSTCSSCGRSNESFEDDNTERQRLGKPPYNRYKVFHQKLDFSHVGSKVDSGLDGKPAKGNGETSDNDISQDSEILGLQRRLYERERELNQLKSHLGINPMPSLEAFNKRGSLASIGEINEGSYVPDVEMCQLTEGGDRGRNVNSVTVCPGDNEDEKITYADGEHTSDCGQISNSSRDYSNSRLNLQSEGAPFPNDLYLKKPDVGKDKESDNKSDTEIDQSDKAKENDKNIKKQSNLKIFNSPYDDSRVQSRVYLSQVNKNKGNQDSQRFKRKVRQLTSFGMLPTRITKETVITSSESSKSDNGLENNKKVKLNEQDKENENTTKQNNVKIFDASADYSSVKSRVFDSSTSGNKSKPQSSNNDKEVDKSSDAEKDDQNKSKENNQSSDNQSNVKIFSSSTDYSHVNSTKEGNQSSKTTNANEAWNEVEDSSKNFTSASNEQEQGKENNQPSLNRINVKIFNSPSNYSHVKSRIIYSSSNTKEGNQASKTTNANEAGNEEEGSSKNFTSASNEQEQGKENNQPSLNRSNVKIFNAPSNYSHVKSRLFDSSSNRSTPESSFDALRRNSSSM